MNCVSIMSYLDHFIPCHSYFIKLPDYILIGQHLDEFIYHHGIFICHPSIILQSLYYNKSSCFFQSTVYQYHAVPAACSPSDLPPTIPYALVASFITPSLFGIRSYAALIKRTLSPFGRMNKLLIKTRIAIAIFTAPTPILEKGHGGTE